MIAQISLMTLFSAWVQMPHYGYAIVQLFCYEFILVTYIVLLVLISLLFWFSTIIMLKQ